MTIWRILLCVVVGIAAAAGPAAAAVTPAPAFDCALIRSSVARAICANPQLSRLNRELRGLYRKALLVGDRQAQMQAQTVWTTERNRLCARKYHTELTACLMPLLKARIAELKEGQEPAAAPVSLVPTPVAPTPLVPAPAVPAPVAPLAAPVAAPAPRPVPAVVPAPAPVVGLAPTAVRRPGAGCTDAIGIVERAVCTDAVLGRWEDRLGKLYQQALDDPLRATLADDQQRWLSDRVGTCGALGSGQIGGCVLQMTKRRIETLVQFINSRDDPRDRPARVQKILSGTTAPPPGLDADSIDRESVRADQSELALNDARSCIRRNAALAGATADAKRTEALMSDRCFAEFYKRLSALELGALAEPSFAMLVKQEIGGSR